MLEVRGLDVLYGDVQVLWDVTFAVQAGEIVTLLGANGAGKSTTLKAISGLVRPRRGSIVLDGVPLERVPAFRVVGMGVAHVPEGRRLWPGMTVMENLLLGAYPIAARAEGRASLEEVLALFPILAERRRQLAGTLSGGEQQMLAIGRALMARPRLLMLDEPSLGLAPRIVEQIFKVIHDISRRRVTILLVEQNAHLALQVADRAYMMETGRIVLSGSGRDLLGDPHVRRAYLGL